MDSASTAHPERIEKRETRNCLIQRSYAQYGVDTEQAIFADGLYLVEFMEPTSGIEPLTC